MRLAKNLPAYFVALMLVAGVIAIVWDLAKTSSGGGTVEVRVPRLSPLADAGKDAFGANCAKCHGANGAGTDKGPPLVHDIYNPGHHSDEAFYMAATTGVRQHHWPFGDMPPQPQVTEQDLAAIVQYVRELQLANGITYRPHRM